MCVTKATLCTMTWLFGELWSLPTQQHHLLKGSVAGWFQAQLLEPAAVTLDVPFPSLRLIFPHVPNRNN
jgi:hypothetical protein